MGTTKSFQVSKSYSIMYVQKSSSTSYREVLKGCVKTFCISIFRGRYVDCGSNTATESHSATKVWVPNFLCGISNFQIFYTVYMIYGIYQRTFQGGVFHNTYLYERMPSCAISQGMPIGAGAVATIMGVPNYLSGI